MLGTAASTDEEPAVADRSPAAPAFGQRAPASSRAVGVSAGVGKGSGAESHIYMIKDVIMYSQASAPRARSSTLSLPRTLMHAS